MDLLSCKLRVLPSPSLYIYIYIVCVCGGGECFLAPLYIVCAGVWRGGLKVIPIRYNKVS